MLLTKKKSFCIEEAIIKSEAKDGEICLVKINLRYPKIVCGRKDPLLIFAKDFYKSIAESFEKYARNELAKKAQEAYNANPESFLPFSAVMKYEITLINEKLLSVVIDMSVCDGVNAPHIERKAQVWERDFGTKCKVQYFMPKKEILKRMSEVLGKDELKRIDLELFALRGDKLEFFLRENGNYRTVDIDLLQKND